MTTANPRLVLKSLKAISYLEWDLRPISVIVGPNGSGKTTTLRSIKALKTRLNLPLGDALSVFGGGPLVNMDAPKGIGALISIAVGGVTWSVPLDGKSGDSISIDGSSVVFMTADPGNPYLISRPEGLIALPSAWGSAATAAALHPAAVPGIARLVELIKNSDHFERPALNFLRTSSSQEAQDTFVDSEAKNLFTVLRNWRLNSDFEERYDFVLQSMRELFPWLRTFNYPNAGQRNSAEAVGLAVKTLPTDWSDGFFSCLVLLAQLASVQGGIAAFDEPENSLHPELIRRIVELAREWARRKGTHVILATHSPVLLDEFREDPSSVFVMESHDGVAPTALNKLKNEDWLRQFSLGDLYSHKEIGATAK